MGDQIKQLRKNLDLTQEKFGDKLGVKRSTVAQWELGINTLTDQMIVSICREWNVNEEWLRTGTGTMFIEFTEREKLMKYTALLLKDTDSYTAKIIKSIIVTYEELDDNSKATFEEIIAKYAENMKRDL